MKHKYPISVGFDSDTKIQDGTVTIDRSTGIVEVRVKGRHETQVMKIERVAQIIYQAGMSAAAAQNKKPRKRRVNRGLLSH